MARPRAKFAPATAASQTPAAPGAGARAARGRGGRAGLGLCARGRPGRPAATGPVPRSRREWPRRPGRAPAKRREGLHLPDPRLPTRKSCLGPPARHRKHSLPFGVWVTGLWAWDPEGLRFPQVCCERSARVSPGSKGKQTEGAETQARILMLC